jgi:hypothetical protein
MNVDKVLALSCQAALDESEREVVALREETVRLREERDRFKVAFECEDDRSEFMRQEVLRLEAELDRLRAIVAAGVDREAAYKLVERELRERGVSLEYTRLRFDPGTTLIEAVDTLKAQTGGG